MQQNYRKNMNIKFQALWDNLVADAIHDKAYQIMIYNYSAKQSLFLKGPYAEDDGYKRFQAENTFLEENFNEFFDYVCSTLNINSQTTSSKGDSKYQDIQFIYVFDASSKDKFLYLHISIKKPEENLKDLGFTTPQLNEILNVINKNNTGILVSSVTGSGKTTTMNTLLKEISKNYKIIGIEQLEGYKGGLALRSDVNRVSIGELRTGEHVEELSQLREHGCQVIATVHANNPLQSIERLDSLSNSQTHKYFDLLIYQTLVNKLCPYCSISLNTVSEYLDNSETTHEANYYARKLQLQLKLKKLYDDVDLSGVKLKSHDGCQSCNNKGTNGLTICASVIPIDPRMHELIEQKENIATYLRLMADEDPLSDNMAGKSAKEHAVYHMLNGIIDPEDVYEKFGYL